MIRQYYREGKGEKRRPLEYLLYFFVIIVISLVIAPVGLDVMKAPKNISNCVLGILVFMVAGSFLILILGYRLADKVARIQMPSMTFKARIIAGRIKRELKPLALVKLLKVQKSPYGYPVPTVAVYVAPNCFSGWVAVENAPLLNRLDSDSILNDLGGLLVGRSLRKFSFIRSELSQDANFYIFHFEDTTTSQRLIVKNNDLIPFVSQNPHQIILAKNLIWRVDGSTPHLAIIGHTRSGKSYFAGHYLLPLMKLQGWKVEFYSVKNDLYVDEFNGEFEPEKIVSRLEYWEKVMYERNSIIKNAGKEKYSEMPKMPDVALVTDEIGSLNGAVSSDRKLKARWETVIGKLTATGASAGIHVIALAQYATKEAFLPTSARANISDAVIFLGMGADNATDRQYLLTTFEVPHRRYSTGQGLARIVSAGEIWEEPHFYETPLFKN